MKPQINEEQFTRAMAAMRHLDIITDADIKYFMASDGSRSTQKFYDDIKDAGNSFLKLPKLKEGEGIKIEEVHVDTAMLILLLATEMIGEEEADKHLSVRPLYGKYADLLIGKKETV